ncbi:MAG: cell division protein FtsI/penicillin-binding protein 2 [Myxococcota bacterium]
MNNKRLIQIAIGFAVLLLVMVARLFQLQIVEAEDWQLRARSSRLDKDTIPFKRGRITSVDGSVLAEDNPVYDLYFRYRPFRRYHPAGQIHAALVLLDVDPPGVDSCMQDASHWAQQLLQLYPQQLREMGDRNRSDLNYYLRAIFDLDNDEQLEEYRQWFDDSGLSLGEYFPQALQSFKQQLGFFEVRITAIEAMLGVSWHQQLLLKIEQRRQQLQLMILQNALQDAAARALDLSPSELRKRLRDTQSRLSVAHLLHQHWKLDGRAEYLAAMLSPVADDNASDYLRDRELSQQVELLDTLWKQLNLVAPKDTSGIWRDQQLRVHQQRVIRFSKEITYDLVDLLAQQGEDYPGLYLQKNSRREFPVALNPLIVGMVRSPLEDDLEKYRALNDSFSVLRKMFYRNAADEAEYRRLRHSLWSAALRPDETHGISGIEHSFEEVLRGVRGYLQVLEGGELGQAPLELLYSVPQDGADVMLSLDAALIHLAEQAIVTVYVETPQRMRQKFSNVDLSPEFDPLQPKVGFALINLKKHGVPMLATTPPLTREQLRKSYRELDMIRDASPLRHRALAGNYWPRETPYPGSTFKPLVAAAALMHDRSLWNRTYHCEGTFQVKSGSQLLNCDSTYGHQEITMRDALKKSCNIYFYKLARDLGAEPIHDLASILGFGENTGFEVPALEKGANHLEDLEKMQNNMFRLMRTSVGQVGVQASPLQMARLYGWLATSSLPSASIVLEGAGASPAISETAVPALNSSSQQLIVEALSAVSYEFGGTAYKTEFPAKWQIVAKTGTSQVAKGGIMQPTHAWFTGYFPADDPHYSFAIMCENTGLHGGQIASFILKEFLEQALPQIAPELVVVQSNVR